MKAGRSDHFSAETYAQLKRIAENQIRKRRGTQSVGVTDLVHEAYDKLKEHAGAWSSRSHFMAVAVHAMWQVLVDHARRRAAEKRGGGRHRLTISVVDLYQSPREIEALELDDVLRRLDSLDPRQGELVRLRFLAGLSMEEVAKQLEVSLSTAESDWRHARAWLRKELAAP